MADKPAEKLINQVPQPGRSDREIQDAITKAEMDLDSALIALYRAHHGTGAGTPYAASQPWWASCRAAIAVAKSRAREGVLPS